MLDVASLATTYERLGWAEAAVSLYQQAIDFGLWLEFIDRIRRLICNSE